MKLGVFTVLFAQKSFEEMLDYVAASGLKAVEIGTGGYPGNSHCPLDEFLKVKKSGKNISMRLHQGGSSLVP